MNGRILLIEDDLELVQLMTEFFSEQGFEVEGRATGPAGLAAALEPGWSLVLLDVMLPEFDGFEVLRRLRAERSVPVIMLTARAESSSRIQGLNGGADDYLPKPFEPMELLARVHAVLRRSAPQNGPVAEWNVSGVRLEAVSRRLWKDGLEVPITSVEYEILETLMQSAGSAVSRDELANRLYGREATPFDRAIDVHISHLRKKLGGSGELIRTVRGVGYQFAVAS